MYLVALKIKIYFSMKNIIPFKELAYTGGLTITGMYVCMYV